MSRLWLLNLLLNITGIFLTLERKKMKTHTHETIRLGDLVVAVFDEAAHYSSDPKEVSRLATQAVMHILRAARNILDPPPPSIASNKTRRSGKQASAEA